MPECVMLGIFSSIRHYFPSCGRHTNRRLAPPSGNLTPPRIAPRCPHKNGWTQSTIIGLRDHCETACQGCFRLGGPAVHLSRPSSFIDQQREKSFYKIYRWSSRTRRIAVPLRQRGRKLTLVRCRIFHCQRTQGEKILSYI